MCEWISTYQNGYRQNIIVAYCYNQACKYMYWYGSPWYDGEAGSGGGDDKKKDDEGEGSTGGKEKKSGEKGKSKEKRKVK